MAGYAIRHPNGPEINPESQVRSMSSIELDRVVWLMCRHWKNRDERLLYWNDMFWRQLPLISDLNIRNVTS